MPTLAAMRASARSRTGIWSRVSERGLRLPLPVGPSLADVVVPRRDVSGLEEARIRGRVVAHRIGPVVATGAEARALDVARSGAREQAVVARDVLAALHTRVGGRQAVEERSARALTRRQALVVEADLEVTERQVQSAEHLHAVLMRRGVRLGSAVAVARDHEVAHRVTDVHHA